MGATNDDSHRYWAVSLASLLLRSHSSTGSRALIYEIRGWGFDSLWDYTMKKKPKRFDIVKIVLNEALTLRVMKGGYSKELRRRLPGGMSIHIDLRGLGTFRDKNSKEQIAAVTYPFDMRQSKKIKTFIQKNLK